MELYTCEGRIHQVRISLCVQRSDNSLIHNQLLSIVKCAPTSIVIRYILTGCEFEGYFDKATKGDAIYDANGKLTDTGKGKHPDEKGITLFAHWKDKRSEDQTKRDDNIRKDVE